MASASEKQTSLTYNLSKLSKGAKFCHYLLTSPEIGFKKISLEHYIDANKSVDLYVHDIDLAIEVDGPVHFYANTKERITRL